MFTLSYRAVIRQFGVVAKKVILAPSIKNVFHDHYLLLKVLENLSLKLIMKEGGRGGGG